MGENNICHKDLREGLSIDISLRVLFFLYGRQTLVEGCPPSGYDLPTLITSKPSKMDGKKCWFEFM